MQQDSRLERLPQFVHSQIVGRDGYSRGSGSALSLLLQW